MRTGDKDKMAGGQTDEVWDQPSCSGSFYTGELTSHLVLERSWKDPGKVPEAPENHQQAKKQQKKS